MKILLVGNYEPSKQQSMQRFVNMIQEGLILEGHEVKVIRPNPKMCKGNQAEYGLNKWLGYIDRFVLFRRQLRQASKWADIVHICDHSNAMYTKWISCPAFVTCHDLMAIKSALGMVENNKVSLTGRLLQSWIVSGLKSADHIFCVSQNTQNELIETLNVSENHTSVTYNALNYPYAPMAKGEAWLLLNKRLPDLKPSYFFHLGGNQWYKNRKGVVEIYSHLIGISEYKDYKLVLAGKPWPNDLRKKVENLGLKNRVIEICDLTNEEIRALYSTTEALIFPSLQEGFGWPIAEAQACGCKVITTGRAPMIEVGGEAAIYIKPERPEQAAEIIYNRLNSDKNLTTKAIENAKRFSLKSMIKSYEHGYEKTLGIINT